MRMPMKSNSEVPRPFGNSRCVQIGKQRSRGGIGLMATRGSATLLICSAVLAEQLRLCTAVPDSKGAPYAGLVMLHGSFGSGDRFKSQILGVAGTDWLQGFVSHGAAIEFPSSGTRHYTLSKRTRNIWFDRLAYQPNAPEQTETVEESVRKLLPIVDSFHELGIPANRIAIGGFSMGGAMSLQFALRYPEKVGAVFSMSSYLCDNAAVYAHAANMTNKERLPIFMAHGENDTFIRLPWGRTTAERLEALGFNVEFLPIPRARHELTRTELYRLQEWLFQRMGLGV